MRRALSIIVVFLTLGCVLNIAAAWGCERLFEVRKLDTSLIAKARRAEFARAEQQSSNNDHRWIRDAFRSPGCEIVRYSSSDLLSEARSSGWPWRSLGCTVDYRLDRSNGQYNWKHSVHDGLVLSGNVFLSMDAAAGTPMGMQAADRVLPQRPLWRGFVGNTVFWAFTLWLAVMIPRWLRGLIWLLRSRCAHCGYPVGTSPVCTECGRRISRWTRRKKIESSPLKS